MTEAERLAEYKQGAAYQARQERYRQWEAQQALKAYNSKNQQADNWIPACTADNPYGLPPARQPALDWLISLYRRSDLPGNTALERTRYILNATESGRYVHFSRIPEGDSGFAPSYQDSQIWPQSSNQVGHYLTALDISIHYHLGDRWDAKHFGFAAVIGHELWGDTFGLSSLPNYFQIAYGKYVELRTGGKVRLWFEEGGDENLEKILHYQPLKGRYFHAGNSIQDLRLSREGWFDGKELVEGKYPRPEDFVRRLERLKR